MFDNGFSKARKGLANSILALGLVSFNPISSAAQVAQTKDTEFEKLSDEQKKDIIREQMNLMQEALEKLTPPDTYDILTSYSFDITLEYPNGMPEPHRLVQVMGVTQPSDVFRLSSEPFMSTNDKGNIRTSLAWPYYGKNVGKENFMPNHIDVGIVYMDTHGSDFHWLAIHFNSTDGKDWTSGVEIFNCPDKRPLTADICTHKPAPLTIQNFEVSPGGEAANALEHAAYGSNNRPYNRFVFRNPSVTVKMNIRLPKD